MHDVLEQEGHTIAKANVLHAPRDHLDDIIRPWQRQHRAEMLTVDSGKREMFTVPRDRHPLEQLVEDLEIRLATPIVGADRESDAMHDEGHTCAKKRQPL